MKPIEVVWYDACDFSGWCSKDELNRLVPTGKRGQLCRTRGWLVSSDENAIVVARDWQPEVDHSDEESMAGVIVIPRGMVSEVIVEDARQSN